MIVNLKTAKVLSITLKRRPLLDHAAIEQLEVVERRASPKGNSR